MVRVGGFGGQGDEAGEAEVGEGDKRVRVGERVGEGGEGGEGEVEKDVFELDVAVDDAFGVEVCDGGDKFGEETLDDGRVEEVFAGACEVEEISAGAVVENEHCFGVVEVVRL